MMWIILASTALAGTTSPLDAVKQFVQAGDKRDVPALQSALHQDFRVLAQMPDGVSVMPRALYIDLIATGKIGGTPRKADYGVVMMTGDLATIRGTLDSPAAHFDCTWTVAKHQGAWMVIQDAVVFSPKAE